MQILPDGYAHYLKHRLADYPKGVRWIARNPDQDALGLFLPATAEHQGYTAEKAKGNVKSLAGGQSMEFHLETGLLDPAAAGQTEANIRGILDRRSADLSKTRPSLKP